MTDREIADQLANPERSIRAIAIALTDACDQLGDTDVENVRSMVSQLTDHDLEIDAVVIPRVLVSLAAIFAAKTDSAPKQLWEQLWKEAPTDAWWSEQVRPTREEPE